MAEFPAMPLWTDAYLADTRHLSTLEHGAYLLLLMEAWRRPFCDLPDDDVLLSRLAGVGEAQWQELKPVVMAMWKLDRRSKVWTQKRLLKEASFVRRKSASNRDAAQKRWNKTKNGDANAMPKTYQNDAPTPTPTPTLKEEGKTAADAAPKSGGDDEISGGETDLVKLAEAAPAEGDGGKPAAPAKAPRAPAIAQALPANFAPVLTEAAAKNATVLGEARFAQEFEKFRDYHAHRGKPGKDWQAAFRTWLTNAVQHLPTTPKGVPYHDRHEDGFARASRERLEKFGAQPAAGPVGRSPARGAGQDRDDAG